MNIARNYSSLRTHESKIYSISGTKISSTGISVTFIKVFGSLFILFNIIGAFICIVAGKFYYWPITSDMEFKPTFLIIFVGIPLGLTFALQYIKIQHYSLLEFLLAYFKPKNVIDQNGSEVKNMQFKQDTLVKKL